MTSPLTCEKYRIQWDPRGLRPHALLAAGESGFDAGFMRHRAARYSPTEAGAGVIVQPTLKNRVGHGRATKLRKGTIRMGAELLTAEPPGLGVFIGAATGVGLPASIAELAGGFLQSFAPPSAEGYMTVEYHVPGPPPEEEIEDEDECEYTPGNPC